MSDETPRSKKRNRTTPSPADRCGRERRAGIAEAEVAESRPPSSRRAAAEAGSTTDAITGLGTIPDLGAIRTWAPPDLGATSQEAMPEPVVEAVASEPPGAR